MEGKYADKINDFLLLLYFRVKVHSWPHHEQLIHDHGELSNN